MLHRCVWYVFCASTAQTLCTVSLKVSHAKAIPRKRNAEFAFLWLRTLGLTLPFLVFSFPPKHIIVFLLSSCTHSNHTCKLRPARDVDWTQVLRCRSAWTCIQSGYKFQLNADAALESKFGAMLFRYRKLLGTDHITHSVLREKI